MTSKDVLNALEDAANRGIDVRVMLEDHPFGGGSVSPQETMAKLRSAGVKSQPSDPEFTLTHEKGLIIDGTTAYIMTANMTNAALGTGSSTKNREYLIADINSQDVQAIVAIFQADWDHTTASFNDPNLVVSPVNSRPSFDSLIASAKQTLLVTSEEMKDSKIEQDLVAAAQRGIKVQVILPAPGSSTASDSNDSSIKLIKKGGVSVREDHHLYMHAKIMIIDGKTAFLGSENISAQSLDENRELGLIIADDNVIQTLQQTFQQDWSDSRTV